LPSQYDQYSKQGIKFFKKKNFAEAERYFDAALNIRNDDPNLWILKADCLAKTGRLDESMQFFNYAIQLDPNNPDIHENKGSMFLEQNRFDEALEAFKRSVELRPNNETALGVICLIYENKGLYREEIEIIDRLLQICPNDKDLIEARNECLGKIQNNPQIKSFCENCGQKLNSDYKFCMSCGTEI
jgi:tetratricopeptide (TPR) repeat protein